MNKLNNNEELNSSNESEESFGEKISDIKEKVSDVLSDNMPAIFFVTILASYIGILSLDSKVSSYCDDPMQSVEKICKKIKKADELGILNDSNMDKVDELGKIVKQELINKELELYSITDIDDPLLDGIIEEVYALHSIYRELDPSDSVVTYDDIIKSVSIGDFLKKLRTDKNIEEFRKNNNK